MEESTPYSSMKEISLVVSSSSSLTSSGYLWDRTYSDPGGVDGSHSFATAAAAAAAAANNSPQHCLIRIVLPEGCLLLQVTPISIDPSPVTSYSLAFFLCGGSIGAITQTLIADSIVTNQLHDEVSIYSCVDDALLYRVCVRLNSFKETKLYSNLFKIIYILGFGFHGNTFAECGGGAFPSV